MFLGRPVSQQSLVFEKCKIKLKSLCEPYPSHACTRNVKSRCPAHRKYTSFAYMYIFICIYPM